MQCKRKKQDDVHTPQAIFPVIFLISVRRNFGSGVDENSMPTTRFACRKTRRLCCSVGLCLPRLNTFTFYTLQYQWRALWDVNTLLATV
jgi:hypothetical protein